MKIRFDQRLILGYAFIPWTLQTTNFFRRSFRINSASCIAQPEFQKLVIENCIHNYLTI